MFFEIQKPKIASPVNTNVKIKTIDPTRGKPLRSIIDTRGDATAARTMDTSVGVERPGVKKKTRPRRKITTRIKLTFKRSLRK